MLEDFTIGSIVLQVMAEELDMSIQEDKILNVSLDNQPPNVSGPLFVPQNEVWLEQGGEDKEGMWICM